MEFDVAELLNRPVSDAGCLGCGRPLHADDAQIHISLTRFEARRLLCTRCVTGQAEFADAMVLFPE